MVPVSCHPTWMRTLTDTPTRQVVALPYSFSIVAAQVIQTKRSRSSGPSLALFPAHSTSIRQLLPRAVSTAALFIASNGGSLPSHIPHHERAQCPSPAESPQARVARVCPTPAKAFRAPQGVPLHDHWRKGIDVPRRSDPAARVDGIAVHRTVDVSRDAKLRWRMWVSLSRCSCRAEAGSVSSECRSW